MASCMAVGYFFWRFFGQNDGNWIKCQPRSWLQAHALWHTLTGLAILSGWFMMRSEPMKVESRNGGVESDPALLVDGEGYEMEKIVVDIGGEPLTTDEMSNLLISEISN